MNSHIRWFHSFELPDGEKIQGVAPISAFRATAADVFKYPVSGRSVLDIGAWNGFYSFEAERLGASDVLATDHFCWSGPGWGTKDGFDYVHAKLNSNVRSIDVDVFDLAPEKHGTYDTVLFLGVLYHLTNPWGGLERAGNMSKDHLVVETVSEMHDIEEPVMRYYVGSELNNDGTNYWGQNAACVVGMLRDLGFKRFDCKYTDPKAKRSRLTVHAWKS